MDPFGLLQTALNRLGLRHNALYDSLRNNDHDRRDLSALYRAAMLALFPLGMLVAVPVSAVLRMLGGAGTLIVVARKTGAPRRGAFRSAETGPSGASPPSRAGTRLPSRGTRSRTSRSAGS